MPLGFPALGQMPDIEGMNENELKVDDTQEIQVVNPDHGLPGDAEPMPEDAKSDYGPDELGEDDDTSDTAPVEIDPTVSDEDGE